MTDVGRAMSGEPEAELRALEAALRRVPNVADCAVLPRSDAGTVKWLAYVVPAGPLSPAKLATLLGEAHPGTRLPDAYTLIDRLPFSEDGRIDGAALEALPIVDESLAERAEAELAARSGVEQALAFVEPMPEPLPPLHLSTLVTYASEAREPAPEQAARAARDDAAPAARDAGAAARPEAVSQGAPIAVTPDMPRTLPELLVRAAERVGEPRIHYLQNDGTTRTRSLAELQSEAERIASGLARHGVLPGSHVLIQLALPEQILAGFWGCLFGGFVPAIAPVPASYSAETNELERLCQIWELLDRPPVLTETGLAGGMAPWLARLGIGPDKLLDVDRLRASTEPFVAPAIDPDAPAFLPLTSGSTGLPKAIMLSHANVISRARGTNLLCGHDEHDRILNWLPFDHIGSISDWHLRCIELGCHMFYCTKEQVLGDPLNWLRLIDRFRITHSWAPNFAYALVNDALGGSSERWDLSCLKTLLTAGEAVSSNTVHEFLERLRPQGLPRTALRPAFGMAELGSGVTYYLPTEQEPVRVRYVDRASLDGALRFVAAGDPAAMGFTSLGPVIPGASMRIVDEHDRPLPECSVGRLQIAGGPVCLGYYKNEAANRSVFVGGGWFNCGDRGFIADGELYLTGRDKETLIINGANFHNSEIEATVEEVPGVRVSFAAACAVRPQGAVEERLAVFFSPVAASDAQLARILHKVANNVLRKTGVKPDYLLPVAPEQIPKTGIGKIQRKQLTKRFEAGELEELVRRSDVLLGNERTLPDWFLRPSFQAKAIRARRALAGRRVLVLCDEHGLGGAVAGLLRAQGLDVVESAPGGNGSAREAIGAGASDVVDLSEYRPWADGEASGAVARRWLDLLERARKLSGASPVRYLAVTSHAQAARAEEAVDPARAAFAPLLRALAREATELECRHVDLEFSAEPEPIAARARTLVDELAADDDEPELVYRGPSRLVPSFRRVAFESSPEAPPLVSGGFYLVTGGLGGVGGELARHLLTRWQARLLLTGQRPIASNGDALDGRRARLGELEALGEVAYRALPMDRAAELETAVSELETAWGRPLAGVFHLAGSYHEAPLLEETSESLTRLLAPKLDGGAAVHALLERRPQAFVVGFSSLASVFSGRGIGAYAAANRALDAHSHEQRRRGRRSYVLNWSLWQGLGMGAAGAPADVLRSMGYLPVAPARGLSSLIGSLSEAPGQLLVGVDGRHPGMARLTQGTPRPLFGVRAAVVVRDAAALEPLTVRDRFGRELGVELWQLPELPLGPDGRPDRSELRRALEDPGAQRHVPPETELQRRLVTIWQEVLAVDSVGITDSFFDLGGTSLLSVKLFARIAKELGITLTPATLFQAPTIRGMAALLDEQAAGTGLDSAVQLASGPGEVALFLLHDGRGEAGVYAALAERLAPALPVYGLEPHRAPGYPALHTRIEDMTRHHLAKIRALQPKGPYLLGGRGVGGVLAFACAAELQARGETVALVALLDAIDSRLRARSAAPEAADGAGSRVKRVLARTRRQLVDYGRLGLLRRYVDRGLTPPWYLQFIPVETVCGFALRGYRPPQLSGALTLFRATQPASADPADAPARQRTTDPVLGWGARAAEGVDVIDVPGGHLSMLHPPYVDELARRLSAAIGSALGRSPAAGEPVGAVAK